MCCILLCSCNSNGRKAKKRNTKADSALMEYKNQKDVVATDQYDSLQSVSIDTNTLKGKRQFIMNQFMTERLIEGPDYDTLVDINYDGFDDYIIGFYAPCGTGIKNGVLIFIYNPQQNRYIEDSILSNIPNPTFYLKERRITSFYLAYGGGCGSRLDFINGKWVETMTFWVDNKEQNSIWQIEYPLNKKKKNVKHPYDMIPPKEILQTNVNMEDAHYRAFQ